MIVRSAKIQRNILNDFFVLTEMFYFLFSIKYFQLSEAFRMRETASCLRNFDACAIFDVSKLTIKIKFQTNNLTSVFHHNHHHHQWLKCIYNRLLWDVLYSTTTYLIMKKVMMKPVLYFCLFNSYITLNMFNIKLFRWLDSNRGHLFSEATALPCEPHHCPWNMF